MGIHSILQSIWSLGFILAAKRSKPSTAFKTSRVFTATKQDHCHVTKSFWYRNSAVLYCNKMQMWSLPICNATERCIGIALFGQTNLFATSALSSYATIFHGPNLITDLPSGTGVPRKVMNSEMGPSKFHSIAVFTYQENEGKIQHRAVIQIQKKHEAACQNSTSWWLNHPFEKYDSKWESSPIFGVILFSNIWNRQAV